MVHRWRFLKIYSLKFCDIWQKFCFYRILNNENFKMEVEQTNFVTQPFSCHDLANDIFTNCLNCVQPPYWRECMGSSFPPPPLPRTKWIFPHMYVLRFSCALTFNYGDVTSPKIGNEGHWRIGGTNSLCLVKHIHLAFLKEDKHT